MSFSSLTTYSAVGVAVFSTGICSWALYKWLETRGRLRKYLEKYNDPKEVQKHLIHHYAQLKDLSLLEAVIPKEMDSYHARLAKFIIDACDEYCVPKVRILDVGCGPGGTSFHLSCEFQDVIGTDTSMQMLMAGQMLKQFNESASAFSNEGGKHISLIRIKLPEGAHRERVTFWDEDVCALSYKCGYFNCVLIANTLTDLCNPKEFLSSIGQYVKPGGLLIISDAYNWGNGPEESIGGKGSNLSISEMRKILVPTWTFKKEVNMPYYFPICARIAEVGNSHVTVWMRSKDPLEE